MAMIHVSRSGTTLGIFEEEKVREGLRTGEFIGTDLGWSEGMPAWRPLAELDSFQTPVPPVQPPIPPVDPVSSGTAKMAMATTTAAAAPPLARTGLPWENREGRGFLNALFETLALVFTRPTEAFDVMKRDDGLADPLLYALICGTAGAVISIGFSLVFQSLGIMSNRNNGMAALFGLGFGVIFLVLLMPIFVIIGTFIGAAITHVCLMVVGGAKQSFETTLRVVCYGSGSANVLQVIPLCGGLVALIASLVLNCIGLARAHETDTWRAVVAILLPFVVCCGGGVFLFFLVIGLAAGGNWH
ncbi:MAG TPA: YIP1 family protein [Chthoniobacterales bacterium]|nr:YIP1 family protein [Chthoniobacterales bacterium]